MKIERMILLAFILITVACKKNKKANEDIKGDPEITIVTPADPGIAKTQGIFLDDWATKKFVAPSYDLVAQTSSAATITVTIDGMTVLTKLPKYLFGTNTNPYIGQMVAEPILINHLKDLAPNIIRFPGGNISSIYFWNATVNNPPADAPPKIYNGENLAADAGYWYGNNAASWTLSLDNYYSMLQQTQSIGIITINYGYARYSTAANPVAAAAHLAADWVRYDNGRTKYWEIGNESNGTWQAGYRIELSQNKDGQPEYITGDLYGRHFKVFADSMKKAAQEIGKPIYIGAQLLAEAPASWATITDKSWNTGVLSQAGNTPDYHIIHSYYTPYNTNSSVADILGSAGTMTKSMVDYVKQMTQANGVIEKPLALTEWNIFAVGSKQMVSNIAGIHADIVLGELLKNQYGMASRWDIANGYNNGDDHGMFSLGDEGNGTSKWNPRPVFYHMYYFQKYFGDRMLASDVQGNSDIVSYASSYSSGEVGTVLINKSTKAQTVKLVVKNYNPGSRYYWYTLTGGGDNGDFSPKVYVNAIGPAETTGGPPAYKQIKAYAVAAQAEIKLDLPARASVYLVIDKK